MSDSFSTRTSLEVHGKRYEYYSLPKLGERFDIGHLPYSMKILLENLLRHEDGGVTVGKDHIEAVAKWAPKAEPDIEIAFMPARVGAAGFHRRALRGRPGGDARCGGQAGRQRRPDQPADSLRTGHRPLGAGRRVRQARRARPQR